ncbi:hypothetical protein PHYSODRAFT_250534 [Phytophthora sojae]|uniref:Uncharacterized protein n=1 Tax=Phytophthora sojae (strain P6497) TaxID=1094619 RepID=G4ZXU6_PHYSP|nr:hypothetical protein PHYSODRAFT_250534 [Phytophthora sojae]EGZ11904.1 hypothetical protein PHYSODRAFT_250534 [Phytophthora sojae]|eukprot:XP_009532237.1 hypothetical protein PHYSODRAFT_250534 [Phytophthora sojae]
MAAAIAFDKNLSLWRVKVALAARKLLSLGRAFEVEYSLPSEAVDELKFLNFGLRVAAVVGSHVFQVSETTSEPPRFPMECKDSVAGRSTYSHPICTIEAGDYLVGIGTGDRLKEVAQDVATLGAEASVKQEQSKSGKKTVVFRFVRMEATQNSSKKRVTFAPDVKGSTPEAQRYDAPKAPKPKIAGVGESRVYLRTLLGSNIVQSLQQIPLSEVLKDQEIRLSEELKHATDTEVAEHQKLYGEMMEYLKSEYGFCKANCTRDVKDDVFNYLIDKNIVRVSLNIGDGVV